MAAPKDAPEQAFRLRKFQGTNTEVDSTFLGPSVVSRSENWIPTQSYRLGKRPGTVLLLHAAAGGTPTLQITNLSRNRDASHFYLYAYCLKSDGAFIQQSRDEAPFTFNSANDPGSLAIFSSPTALGRMIPFRDRMYAGNGVDPLVSWKLGDPPANTLVFSPITDLGPPPAPTHNPVDPASSADRLPTGVYQYCWARLDT